MTHRSSGLCQLCRIDEATGTVGELHLCDDCASDYAIALEAIG